MPSTLLSLASGAPFPLVSGNFWSGVSNKPCVGGIQFRLDRAASGNAYISLSGGGTIQSGSFFMSGINTTDGMQIGPGDGYFIPRVAFTLSGQLNVFVTCDPACSGQARLFWEAF